nr:tripartite motif-containing protein 10-like [Anolis sagrei ordinatus]
MPNEAPSPMASPVTALVEDVTCSICLEFLKDPVSVDCGHNFCQLCITAYCDSMKNIRGNIRCPFCKASIQKWNFRPNWHLVNIIENIKRLPEEQVLCKKHKEKLNLFCKEDEKLLCVFCEHSAQHQEHTVLLLEKAAQEYKDRIHCHLQNLRKEKEKIMGYTEVTEKDSQQLLVSETIQAERVKTATEFRQLRQFLERQEKLLLDQIDNVQRDIERIRDEHLTRLSSEISSLDNIMQEMEKKQQQSADQLLRDVKGIIRRWEKKDTFLNSVTFPSALKWKIWDFCDKNPYLKSVFEKFKGLTPIAFSSAETIECLPLLQTADITMDPDTAHPRLLLSEDGKNLRGSNTIQDLPNNIERFTEYPSVLGSQGFTEGRHSWEVTGGNEGFWVVGVARESVKRKEDIEFTPEEGIWAMESFEGKYQASSAFCSSPLPLSRKPEKIRVILNYDGGHVAFFDGDTADLLLAFSHASFCGETLFPFFYVFGNAHLRLLP